MHREKYSPGQIIHADTTIGINQGRILKRILVENTGTGPISVGSHYHFREANPMLSFNRNAVHGFRLNIPAGDYMTFTPGETRRVDLVEIY